MALLKKIIDWVLGLFQKSETPEIDAKIKERQERIKKLDEELEKEYNDVKDAMSEWRDK